MRRIISSVVAAGLLSGAVVAPATAQTGEHVAEVRENTLGNALESLNQSSQQANSSDGGEQSSTSELPVRPIIAIGVALGFVALANLILNFVNAKNYHTLFSPLR